MLIYQFNLKQKQSSRSQGKEISKIKYKKDNVEKEIYLVTKEEKLKDAVYSSHNDIDPKILNKDTLKKIPKKVNQAPSTRVYFGFASSMEEANSDGSLDIWPPDLIRAAIPIIPVPGTALGTAKIGNHWYGIAAPSY